MRILIISDSHGHTNPCDRAIYSFKPDMIFHLGDIERDVQYLQDTYPEIKLEAVLGNNDFYCRRETEKVVTVCGVKIFLTHGHLYSVFDGGARIARRAAELGCKVAFFGHSHIACDNVFDGVRVVNPGSIAQPRKGNASVGVMEIENDGKFDIVLCDWI